MLHLIKRTNKAFTDQKPKENRETNEASLACVADSAQWLPKACSDIPFAGISVSISDWLGFLCAL